MSTRWQPVGGRTVADNRHASGCQHQGNRRPVVLTGSTCGATAYCSRVSTVGYCRRAVGVRKGGVLSGNVSTLCRPLDHAIPGAPWSGPNEPRRYDPQPLRDLAYQRAVSRDRDVRARAQRARQPEQATDCRAAETLQPWAHLLCARKELATGNPETTGDGPPSVRPDGTPLQRGAICE